MALETKISERTHPADCPFCQSIKRVWGPGGYCWTHSRAGGSVEVEHGERHLTPVERLRELRKSRGMSVEDLAKESRVNPHTLKDMERRKGATAWRRNALKLAHALGVEPEDLAAGAGFGGQG